MSNYVEQFRESYNRVLLGTLSDRDFFDAFYERFIESSPIVKEKFKNTDMAKQKKILMESMFHLLDFFATREFSSHMRRIARTHSKSEKNISPELYDLWLEVLIKTLREFDTEFNKDIELAWRLVLSPGITFLKFEYESN